MRTRAAVVIASALVATTVGASPALAAPQSVHVQGGTTKVTVAPAVTKALLSNGVAPIVTKPGKPGVAVVDHKPTLTATYPITGGELVADPLGGTIKHKGGLKFTNLFNGRSLEVKNFTIDLDKGELTGRVAGTTSRVPVFDLDLSKAEVEIGDTGARATNVGLKLTSEAASALNSTLKTKVFAEGLTVGTADTGPRF